MDIEKIINWFKAAKPNPTDKDKATQIFNNNGKIMKGENYFKPDLAKFVRSNNAPAAE